HHPRRHRLARRQAHRLRPGPQRQKRRQRHQAGRHAQDSDDSGGVISKIFQREGAKSRRRQRDLIHRLRRFSQIKIRGLICENLRNLWINSFLWLYFFARGAVLAPLETLLAATSFHTEPWALSNGFHAPYWLVALVT